MTARRISMTLAVMVTAIAAFSGTAAAATQLGTNCVPSVAPSGLLLVDPATGTAPSAGLITKWGFGFPPSGGGPTYPQQLLVLAPSGTPNGWTVVSASTPLDSVLGGSSTSVHIPIKAGQVIADWGSNGTLACSSSTATLQAVSAATVPTVGSTVTTSSAGGSSTNGVYATVEADADADGFGDDTQDGCPQSAKFQIACPAPKLAAKVVSTTKSFSALVTTDILSTAVASASVKLPAAGKKKAKTINFTGKTVNTAPGTFSTVKLKWPSALTKALAGLSKSKTLKVSVTVTSKGILSDGVQKFTVKLPGKK